MRQVMTYHCGASHGVCGFLIGSNWMQDELMILLIDIADGLHKAVALIHYEHFEACCRIN